MGRQYNLAERILSGGKKPTVVSAEDHEFTINNSRSVAIMLDAISKDKDLGEFEQLDKMITTALGKEASDYLMEQDFPEPVYVDISKVIMASLANLSLEEVEEQSQTPRKRRKK